MRIDIKIYDDYENELSSDNSKNLEELEKNVESLKKIEIDNNVFKTAEAAKDYINNSNKNDFLIFWGYYSLGPFEKEEINSIIDDIFSFIS